MSELNENLGKVRLILADAMRTIDGVEGAYPYPNTISINPGDAWPLFNTGGAPNFGTYPGSWYCLFVLGQDIEQAERRLDALVPSAYSVMQEHLVITGTQVIPLNALGQSVTTGSSLLAYVLQGTR